MPYASGLVDSATDNFSESARKMSTLLLVIVAKPLLNLKASRAVVLLLIKRAGNGQFVI